MACDGFKMGIFIDMTFGQVFDTYQHMALVSAAVKFRQIKEVKHV